MTEREQILEGLLREAITLVEGKIWEIAGDRIPLEKEAAWLKDVREELQ